MTKAATSDMRNTFKCSFDTVWDIRDHYWISHGDFFFPEKKNQSLGVWVGK